MELVDCLHAVRVEVGDVLAMQDIDSTHDERNLFDMGMDSLCAIELLSRLRDRQGLQISVATIFENPTIRELAQLVYASGRADR